MTDLSDFEALNSHVGRNRCTIGTLLASLEGETRDRLAEALTRPHEGPGKIEHAAIERWLKKNDIASATSQTIGRHRVGQCSCAR